MPSPPVAGVLTVPTEPQILLSHPHRTQSAGFVDSSLGGAFRYYPYAESGRYPQSPLLV